MTALRRYPVGAEVSPDGGVHFRVWAPSRKRVRLVTEVWVPDGGYSPEGEYDLSVAPRGELVGMFGLRGTRVRVVDGKVLEVALAK